MDIAQEINKHLAWIETVASLIGNEEVSQDELRKVAAHDYCALGQWLDSEASARFKDLPELAQLRENHDAFHELAGDLIAAAQASNETRAIASEEKFLEMSQAVISHLHALQETGAK